MFKAISVGRCHYWRTSLLKSAGSGSYFPLRISQHRLAARLEGSTNNCNSNGPFISLVFNFGSPNCPSGWRPFAWCQSNFGPAPQGDWAINVVWITRPIERKGFYRKISPTTGPTSEIASNLWLANNLQHHIKWGGGAEKPKESANVISFPPHVVIPLSF